jgi:hypothetical protein
MPQETYLIMPNRGAETGFYKRFGVIMPYRV